MRAEADTFGISQIVHAVFFVLCIWRVRRLLAKPPSTTLANINAHRTKMALAVLCTLFPLLSLIITGSEGNLVPFQTLAWLVESGAWVRVLAALSGCFPCGH